MVLSKEELWQIKGGSISGTVIEAAIKVVNVIYNLGRTLGSSIWRVVNKNYCKPY